jgi:F-type H+-transporting ATPase subunit b
MRFSILLVAAALVTLPLAGRAEEPHGAPAAHEANTRQADVTAGDHHQEKTGHGSGQDAHGGHGEHHVPTFDDINWFYGMLGARDGVEPSIAFRPTGMPAPFGAWLLNAALLYGVIFRYAKKPLAEALKNRKSGILRGMNEAKRMRKDAQARLDDYESKLERIDEEIERVTKEMREAAATERQAVLKDARERRERMERDARLLIEQELSAAREGMKRELVSQALASATETLKKRLTEEDGRRLADEYLSGIKKAGGSLRVRA